jgi:ribose transport system ATP-binding protein
MVVITLPRLDVKGLSKTFGPARVLSDVRLAVAPGEVHGLVGQNGSGKSTLTKILTGYHAPDPGAQISVDGARLRLPVRWTEVHQAGVAVVHQDLGLLDQLTVAENICVGNFPTSRYTGRIDANARDAIAADILRRLEVAISPRAVCGSLTASQRAEVAIARALRDQTPGSGLTILDESTRALSGDALTHFHDLIRRVAASGGAILMISHNLTEILAVTDRVTVLRDGKVTGGGLRTAELSEAKIAAMMLGKPLTAAAGIHSSRSAQAARFESRVAVTDLSAPGLERISFTVGAGEILGITGLPGSGFERIPYLTAGGVAATSGRLNIDAHQVDLTKGSVAASLRAGAVLVPERRDRDGLAFDLSASENVALPSIKRRGAWLVRRRWQREGYQQAVRELGISPPSPARLIKELSGGNQQKVLLAKWMSTGPACLVLHEPTQAVDVGAREDLLSAVKRAADDGVSVVLATAEPSDLAQVCDRVLVYRKAAPPDELTQFDQDSIITAVYGERRVSTDAKENG